MFGKRISRAAAIGLIVVAAATVAAAPQFQLLRGVSLDVATALAWRMFGDRNQSSPSPTVVVALDEETYRTPPFKGTPTVTWTGEIARVLAAVLGGGARVIGFDVVFPTTIEDSEIGFQGETIGERMRGFDRDFLRALNAGATAGKIVLGEIQLNEALIAPAAGQRAAVGQIRNVRSLNVYGDADGVVRRVPLALSLDGVSAASMSLELASRWLSAPPHIASDGIELGGYAIPSFVVNAMTLNFGGGSDQVPTYSLADLRACAEKNDADFFRRNFAGKVVLFGSKLDVEDRKTSTRRFISAPEGRAAERCVSNPISPPPSPELISGVYVQAAAVNNLLRREAVVELSDRARWLIALGAAALGAAAASRLTPLGVALAYVILCFVSGVATAAAFHDLIALPLIEAALAGFLAIVATTGFRLFVTDKDKRLLRRTFEFYLPRSVIEKLIVSDRPPQLGGELRDVTLFFSDLVRFSTLAEKMPAPDLVALLNRYLAEMSDVIEAHGGFIDKYVGDAIVAVFGAPLDDARHAERAVRAALTCCERLAALNAESKAQSSPALAHRIGVNSGRAIVGNVGSPKRFNYTVIGDAVNLASRLEGANRCFDTSIIASEKTAELAGPQIVWRELDVVRVKGRAQSVRIFEPLGVAGSATTEQMERAEGYREGLALWRAGDFFAAASQCARFADTDPPSARLLERSTTMAQETRPEGWEPVLTLE